MGDTVTRERIVSRHDNKNCRHIEKFLCPKQPRDCIGCPVETLVANINLFQEENKMLEETLEWYASAENYKPQRVYRNNTYRRIFSTVKPIEADNGERARKALGGENDNNI